MDAMKRFLQQFILLVAVVLVPLTARASLADQKICADGAKAFFENFEEKHSPRYSINSYKNHYNIQLGKCFIQVTSLDKNSGAAEIVITDVFENVRYAFLNYESVYESGKWEEKLWVCSVYRYFGIDHIVLSCDNRQEFDWRARPLMTE